MPREFVLFGFCFLAIVLAESLADARNRALAMAPPGVTDTVPRAMPGRP